MSSYGPGWVGQTLSNRYKIESILGRGGMSSVYRAHDPNLNRKVAVKIIHQHLSENAEFIQRFEQEAALIAQLRHPNIIQVHDFNHDGKTYYMVMEYIAGETLSHRLEALKNAGMRLPLPDTVRIMAKICSAVDYAHQRRMIHRDLKPANVMIDLLGEPTLMDFGIAKLVGSVSQAGSGMPLGTAAYMSPEQVRGDEADHRSDIYSLGIMLYEMLSGDPPFNGDSTYQVMIQHVNEPIPDIQSVEMNTPRTLVDIMERALAKNPDGRFQTAGEMTVALNTVGLQLQGPADNLANRHLDRLGHMWQQAGDLYDDRQWRACIEKLDELRRADPDYQHHKVSSMRRDALERLSKQAERDFTAGMLAESLAAVTAVRRFDPEYPVNELEFKVRMGMQQADLQSQLEALYTEAQGCLELRDYEQALAKWRSIQLQRENVDFPDRMMVEKRAKEGACGTLYTAALAALTHHQPEMALDKLARIREIDPQFPDSEQVAAKAKTMQNQPPAAPPRSRRSLAWAGGVILLLLLLAAAALIWRERSGDATTDSTTAVPATTIAIAPVESATPSPTSTPTSTAVSTRTPSATPSLIAPSPMSSSPTPMSSSPSPSPTRPLDQATVLENVSVFALPAADTPELAVVEAGDKVWVLGRSETGSWLYIIDENGNQGFASAARFDWPGNMADLPIHAATTGTIVPTAVPLPSTNNLLLDFYQLDGTQICNGEAWSIRIFIAGRGGTGIYNYYWNDVLQASDQTGSTTFVLNSDGGPIIGTGRVTSGNLSAEKELFLVKPVCN